MKKKLVYGFAIIAGLASCHDDYTDWAAPQSNAANAATEKFTLVVQPSISSIDFATETAESIQLFTTNLQGGQTDAYTLTFSAEDKTETVVLTATPEGKVTSEELQDVVATIYGKAPEERTLNVAVEADVTITTDDGAIIAEKKATPFTLKVTLDAPQISEHYYLIGAPSSWNLGDTSLPFSHSGKNVYDDPVFTCTFPVEDGEVWFAITDDVTLEENDWSYVFGCAEGNGENGMEGKLKRRTGLDNDGSWKVVVDGDAKFLRVTLNMMDYSYTIEKLNFGPYIYEIGNESSWAISNPLYCGDGNGNYQGYYYLNGAFKFKPNLNDWIGDYECSGEGTLTQDGSDNCPDPGAGFYQINVDLAAMTYSLTKVTSITCVGNHNGWNQADEAQHMTYNTELGCWELTSELTNGFKFAMNDDWTISWGGANDDPTAYDNLTQNNGKDLNVPDGDGTYLVRLYISYEGNNRVELTKQ